MVLIDTASAYQNGHTEKVLGTLLAAHPELRAKISIHTKANTMQLPWKSLSCESVLDQAAASLHHLQIYCIDIYYLHDIHSQENLWIMPANNCK
jgi:aryl-alcohol dehydrogenase-like predicted oxidoreductase